MDLELKNKEQIVASKISCIGVKRQHVDKWGQNVTNYLICNGSMTGKWTTSFGVNCIADTSDCIDFARAIARIQGGIEFSIDVVCSF